MEGTAVTLFILCLLFAAALPLANGGDVGGDSNEATNPFKHGRNGKKIIKDLSFVAPGRMPYMVSLRTHGERMHVCSGVLIHHQFVVTLATCVDPQSIYSAGLRPIVHIGGTNVHRTEDVEVHTIEHTIIHEEWLHTKLNRSPYNIALLKLPEKSLKKVPQILYNHFNISHGETVTAVGWAAGTVIKAGDEVFNDLKTESTEYIVGDVCNRSSLWNGTVPKNLMCGLNNGHKASCLVDSGAPMMRIDMPDMASAEIASGNPELDFVIGLNVAGEQCGTADKPDIYLDLRFLYSWINDNIKCQESQCPPSGWGKDGEEKSIFEFFVRNYITSIVAIYSGTIGIIVLYGAMCCKRGNESKNYAGSSPSIKHSSTTGSLQTSQGSEQINPMSDSNIQYVEGIIPIPEPAPIKSPFTHIKSSDEKRYRPDRFMLLDGPDSAMAEILSYDPPVTLGSGGSGTVQKARYDNHDVVIKKYNDSTLDTELSILKKIGRHPNIVYFYGVKPGFKDGFIVMEFVHKNLEDFFRDLSIVMSLTYDQVLHIALDIINGLLRLHEHEITHGDLKPSNVLIQEITGDKIVPYDDCEVGFLRFRERTYSDLFAEKECTVQTIAKLTDFNHSVQRSKMKMTAKWVGTMGYMAPELMCSGSTGAKVDGRKLDVYSFGVLIGDLITGESSLLRTNYVMNESLNWFQQVYPKELIKLIARCVSPSPNSRPSCSEIREYLLSWINVNRREWGHKSLERSLIEVIRLQCKNYVKEKQYYSETGGKVKYDDLLTIFENVITEFKDMEGKGINSKVEPDCVLVRKEGRLFKARIIPCPSSISPGGNDSQIQELSNEDLGSNGNPNVLENDPVLGAVSGDEVNFETECIHLEYCKKGVFKLGNFMKKCFSEKSARPFFSVDDDRFENPCPKELEGLITRCLNIDLPPSYDDVIKELENMHDMHWAETVLGGL